MKDSNIIIKAIPNSLTIFRCVAAVILPLLIIYGGELGARIAPVLLILAGLSDFLDGFYARKYNVVTNFGKIIDIKRNFYFRFKRKYSWL